MGLFGFGDKGPFKKGDKGKQEVKKALSNIKEIIENEKTDLLGEQLWDENISDQELHDLTAKIDTITRELSTANKFISSSESEAKNIIVEIIKDASQVKQKMQRYSELKEKVSGLIDKMAKEHQLFSY